MQRVSSGNGNTTGGTDLTVSTGDDITFADSSKAIFGASSDLQIYHNGSNSIIEAFGVNGDLVIKGSTNIWLQSSTGENYLRADSNGGVTSYDGNAIKLAITATGDNNYRCYSAATS